MTLCRVGLGILVGFQQHSDGLMINVVVNYTQIIIYSVGISQQIRAVKPTMILRLVFAEMSVLNFTFMLFTS